jgi:hypothetical protein
MAKAKGKSTRPAKTAARNVDQPAQGRDGIARPSSKDAVAKAVARPPSKDRPASRASGSNGGGSASRAAATDKATEKKSSGPRAKPAPTKRTAPPPSARYTPPIPKSQKVSPLYVPIIMFAALGLGMIIIILNYVSVWPGSPSNVYLFVGLALITIGFITATKYH